MLLSIATSRLQTGPFDPAREFVGLRPAQRSNHDGVPGSLGGRVACLSSRQSRWPDLAPTCIASPPEKPAVVDSTKRSKVEIIKQDSNYLRFPLMDELSSPAPNIKEEAAQLMKFHGSYQQDDREKRSFGAGKAWQFMMRTKQPAGKVTNQLYLTMDELANKYGNETLRLTTRQTFQMHGIVKEDLQVVFSTVIKNMGSTLGACGDLNRNVLAPAAPFKNRPEYVYAQEYADKIAALLAPQSGAYYDVWVNGEKAFSVEDPPDVVAARNDNSHGTNLDDPNEPIYGTQYLPRKFKVAVTVPGDNSVDILTNDLGLVVITDATGKLEGFNIYVGGGMGRTHRNEETFPRLADPLGYVAAADVLHAVKAIVATQRDHGRRDDRRMARMKYLIHSWGIDKFRTVVEQYFGKRLEAFRELPPWQFQSYLGWHEQGDGRWFYGVHVENGRLKGSLKSSLAAVIREYDIPVIITPNQNILLCDIRKAWKTAIVRTLTEAGFVPPAKADLLDVTAMACPALPLCSLAVTEAERGLPDILLRLRAVMRKAGLTRRSDTMVVRMTGCPNGCARPYMAELGFVGDGPNSYQIWLGGCPNQTRLAETFAERVKVHDLESFFEPIFAMWKELRHQGEPFGDFVVRMGFEKVRMYQGSYLPRKANVRKTRVPIEDGQYKVLTSLAEKEGLTTEVLVAEAIKSYLSKRE